MTKQILVRADDLGYSRGVNYGIYDATHIGMIRNVGIMVNMPFTQHGWDLIKDMPDLSIGLHTDISNGRPITDPKLLPSITTPDGFFKHSKVYRSATEDFVDYDEVVMEIEAQYQALVALIGRKPDYFEGHAVVSENFVKGMKAVAAQHNVPFLDFAFDGSAVPFKGKKMKPIMSSVTDGDNYDAVEVIKSAAEYSLDHDDEIPMVIFHCGYLDEYILTNSSLTRPRPKEVAAACDPDLIQWLKDKQIQHVKYSEL